MKLIAYMGCSKSGKDYEAKKLLSTGKYIQMNMADSVKEIVYNQINYTPANHDEYETLKETSFWNNEDRTFTGRDLIKNLTNEINKIDPNFWFEIWKKKIEQIVEDYKYYHKFEGIVVTDIRYIQSMKYFFGVENLTKKVFFCNYKSDRYKLHEDESEDLIRKIINDLDVDYITKPIDITNYCRDLI